MKHLKQHARACVAGVLLAMSCCVPAMAASGDVAGAVEQTWKDAATQIKTVVDNVVFPALTMVLAIAFFCKAGALLLLSTASMASLSGMGRPSCLSA